MNNKYNTINSNTNNNSIKTNKFELRVLDHFHNMKNSNTGSNINLNPNKKFNIIPNKKNEKDTKNLNKKKTYEITNEKIRSTSKNNKYILSTQNDLKKNKNQNPNTIFDPIKSKEKKEKLQFLMSDNFKNSLDISLNNDKSFQNSFSKLNKTVKKTNIFLDLQPKNEKRDVSAGERLYRKSIAFKDLKEKNCFSESKRKEKEEINKCSFTPKISNESYMNVKVKK